MPTIAITPCSKLHDYEESVRRAGGDIRLLDPPTDSVRDVLRVVDGVLLTGGGDVDPSLYGEPRHPTFTAAEEGRDAYEIELVREALAADLPLLAICRGVQVLNVARDGTLYQDISDQPGAMLNHTVSEPTFAIAHDVWVAPGSRLEALIRDRLHDEACAVNSRHHQAVKALGHGLVATATAPDGVIEALEDPARRFCLGVQWHPENFYRTGEFREIFQGFVDACQR